jgi:MFS family permease
MSGPRNYVRGQYQRLAGMVSEYPRPFWTLVIATFIDHLGGALLFPFFSLYITRRFNVGMTEVGILFAMFSISSFVGAALGGALTDRIGRKGMLIFSLLATSLSSLMMGFVGSIEAFYLLALLTGIFTDSGGPARQAMVADLLPEMKRAQGYGIIRVAFNLSVAIGPAIGGFMATRSYLILFIADAVMSCITAIFVMVAMPETKPASRPGEIPESVGMTFAGYFRVLRDRVYMVFLAASMLSVFVYMNMNTTLGVYLRDVHSVPEAGYGFLLSLNAAMVVFMQFPITRRIEKLAPMWMMTIGTAMYAIGFGMYGVVSSYGLFVLAMVIITIGEMIVSPVAQALVAQMSPADMRGRYMAVFGFSWSIPYAAGPLLAGLVLDNLDPHWLWYAAFVIGVAATAAFYALHRQRLKSVSVASPA